MPLERFSPGPRRSTDLLRRDDVRLDRGAKGSRLPIGQGPDVRSRSMGGSGDRYVVFGLTPLAYEVAKYLDDRGVSVVVIPGQPRTAVPGQELRESIVVVPSHISREEALDRAGLHEAKCLLSLTDDPVENLRTIVAAWQKRPETEVVVETFDQALAYHLEREGIGVGVGEGNPRKVRRAFSEASLAAPYFVAEALRSKNLLTTRFADRQVPFFSTRVIGGSDLSGKAVEALEEDFGCAVVALCRDGSWTAAPADKEEVRAGDELLLSGLDSDVVKAAYQNTPATERVQLDVHAAAKGLGGRLKRFGQGPLREFKKRPALTRLSLVFFLALAVAVAGVALASKDAYEGLVRLPTLWTRTALGEEEFAQLEENDSLKLLGLLALFLGTGLVAIVTGYLSSVATRERVDPEAGARRHARHSLGHVVIAGLGELGYRIARLLSQAKVNCVVVSPAEQDPYLGATETLAPVLTGSIRLEENLTRANLASASALIACSGDHLSNVEACFRARRLADESARPVRTVASVSRDSWAAEAAHGFGVERTLGAADKAAPTFAQAASEPKCMHRIDRDGLQLDVVRLELEEDVGLDQLARWRALRVRIVAVAHGSKPNRGLPTVERGVKAKGAEAGGELLLVGPRGALDALVAHPPFRAGNWEVADLAGVASGDAELRRNRLGDLHDRIDQAAIYGARGAGAASCAQSGPPRPCKQDGEAVFLPLPARRPQLDVAEPSLEFGVQLSPRACSLRRALSVSPGFPSS